MTQHLLLVLEAPLVSFGREAVDARGPVSDFPGASLLTGLLANALGLRREQRAAHARLQARLVFASRIDRPGTRLTDFQTAQLGHDDAGWTTRGRPEGRAGGRDTYNAPHIRYREYDADKRVVVALRLLEAGEAPTLHDLAQALQTPARPLFIGRKPCIPTVPLFGGLVQEAGLLQALATLPPPQGAGPVRLDLPTDEGPAPGDRRVWSGDLRDWRSGVHAGGRERTQRTLQEATRPTPRGNAP